VIYIHLHFIYMWNPLYRVMFNVLNNPLARRSLVLLLVTDFLRHSIICTLPGMVEKAS